VSFDGEIIDEYPCIYIEGMSRDYCRDKIRANAQMEVLNSCVWVVVV